MSSTINNITRLLTTPISQIKVEDLKSIPRDGCAATAEKLGQRMGEGCWSEDDEIELDDGVGHYKVIKRGANKQKRAKTEEYLPVSELIGELRANQAATASDEKDKKDNELALISMDEASDGQAEPNAVETEQQVDHFDLLAESDEHVDTEADFADAEAGIEEIEEDNSIDFPGLELADGDADGVAVPEDAETTAEPLKEEVASEPDEEEDHFELLAEDDMTEEEYEGLEFTDFELTKEEMAAMTDSEMPAGKFENEHEELDFSEWESVWTEEKDAGVQAEDSAKRENTETSESGDGEQCDFTLLTEDDDAEEPVTS